MIVTVIRTFSCFPNLRRSSRTLTQFTLNFIDSATFFIKTTLWEWAFAWEVRLGSKRFIIGVVEITIDQIGYQFMFFGDFSLFFRGQLDFLTVLVSLLFSTAHLAISIFTARVASKQKVG